MRIQDLGYLQVELEEALPVTKFSPSQLCRRERRAEARRLAGAANAEEVTAEVTIVEEPIAAKVKDDKSRAENVKVDEPLLEVTEVRFCAEEAATKEIEVETVSRDIAGKALARNLEVKDEFGQTKCTLKPNFISQCTTTNIKKVAVFDYWTLTYDDIADSITLIKL